MADYAKLHGMVSHRIALEYDTGAKVTGYLSKCIPPTGIVEFCELSSATLWDSTGRQIQTADTLVVSPNMIAGFSVDEGPRGRDRN